MSFRGLSGLKDKLVCHLKLVVRGGIREFVCDTGGAALLERELVVFVVDRHWRSEFTNADMDWWPYMHFESILPVSPM